MKKKILVIQTAFTGDAILATSLLEQLRTKFPNVDIDLLIRKGNEGLFNGHPFLRKLYVWEKKKAKLWNLFRLLLAIRKEQYDHVINLQRFAGSGFLTAFSKGKETIGFDKNPLSSLFSKKIKHVIGDGRHEIARNAELIAHLAGNEISKPKLYPTDADRLAIKKYQQSNYSCMAPGSVWFTKTWPEDQWIELATEITSRKSTELIYLLGAPGEQPLCERISKALGENRCINLAGRLSLLESAALMEKASMNYVNDSAPMHLASSMNAPVTAIYCSTIPAFGFGPLSTNSKTVETSQTLGCRPCGLHGHKGCPEGHFICAKSIKITDIIT